jgi:hypothetical protein
VVAVTVFSPSFEFQFKNIKTAVIIRAINHGKKPGT